MIIGIIAVNLPFMVLSLQSVIEGIDRAVEEAAFSLAHRPPPCSAACCGRSPCPASWPAPS